MVHFGIRLALFIIFAHCVHKFDMKGSTRLEFSRWPGAFFGLLAAVCAIGMVVSAVEFIIAVYHIKNP
jgi:hypothetical protein